MTTEREAILADDSAQVLSVLARYAHLIDDGRRNELDTVFTSDARIDLFGEPIDGPAALAERLGGDAPANGRRHLNANIQFRLLADEAEAVSDWFLIGPADHGGWCILAVGRYEDLLHRTPSGWRIVERRMTRVEAQPA